MWFDPRNGGALQAGTVATVDGGSAVDLGEAPNTAGEDWAVLVRLQGVSIPNIPPSVSFLTPSATDNFTDPATVTVEVNATDSDGSIDHIDLYVNGVFNRAEGRAPYVWSLTDLAKGPYTLRAVAFDDDGAESEVSVTITVDPVIPPATDTRQISLTVDDDFAVDVNPGTATFGSISAGGETTHTFGDLNPNADHILDIMPGGDG